MKNILVLGSGFTARPLVDYLLHTGRYRLAVTGLTRAEAERVTQKRAGTTPLSLDINDEVALRRLISEADFVVSLLPYEFHARVARHCIELGKSMLTTSYAKDDIYQLDSVARKKNVLILKEIGLDPGFDHISAMRIIHRVQEAGGRIASFISYAGGVPAPEADTNPLHYKFSWSPRGVLLAARSDACYMRDRVVIDVPGKDVLLHTWRVPVDEMEFEAYPNRDSIPYIKAYGIEGVETIIRATLRYPGWSETMAAFHRLGLLGDTPLLETNGKTNAAILRELLARHYAQEPVTPGVSSKEDLKMELLKQLSSQAMLVLQWLELFAEVPFPAQKRPLAPIDFLLQLMFKKMQYAAGERDMIVLAHDFIAVYPDRRERITARLLEYGDPEPGGYSAMARTVGLPAAVAADSYLRGEIQLSGVQIPVVKEIYEPVLQALIDFGFAYEEQTQPL